MKKMPYLKKQFHNYNLDMVLVQKVFNERSTAYCIKLRWIFACCTYFTAIFPCQHEQKIHSHHLINILQCKSHVGALLKNTPHWPAAASLKKEQHKISVTCKSFFPGGKKTNSKSSKEHFSCQIRQILYSKDCNKYMWHLKLWVALAVIHVACNFMLIYKVIKLCRWLLLSSALTKCLERQLGRNEKKNDNNEKPGAQTIISKF